MALDPVPLQDDDRYDVPEPVEVSRKDVYDILDYTLFKPVQSLFDIPRGMRRLAGKPKPAPNVTPLDEIQDSTWWENRIGARDITAEEMRRGPNAPIGPDLDGPWMVVRAKTQGVTPGFTIEDPRGDRFVIKFDPFDYPELATGAEAICTRLFWALGYHVPQNYLVNFDPAILQIAEDAKVGSGKKKRGMTREDMQIILDKVPRNPDGTLRAIASRLLQGKPIGPFSFLGTRKDDLNDVIQHEHRRELRAYRVFCSWVNHNDSREINTLDMYVEEEGRHFVKHYLIDFGATLGSRSYNNNLRSEGYEYIIDFGIWAKSFLTLGLWTRPWTQIEYPEIRGLGRFEAEHFVPQEWKPDYFNPAFSRMNPRDAFWAAKLVMRVDDDLVRAAVESAEFSDSRATSALVEALIARRDRIGRYWLSLVNPLDEFEVRWDRTAGPSSMGPTLYFKDLAEHYGLWEHDGYRIRIRGPQGEIAELESERPEVDLTDAVRALGSPSPDDFDDRLLTVSIRSFGANGSSPKLELTLLLHASGELRIVRIERGL
jgi:hypothetical protein